VEIGGAGVECTRIIRASGAGFNTRQVGDTPRAVFLHGFAGDLHTWDGVWQSMGDALPALRYDLRGYGRSACPDRQPFSHADDLLAILDVEKLGTVDLVGVSMGGSVALNFALDHPQRVRSLVLLSPGLVAWEWSAGWRDLWDPIVARARAGSLDAARRMWWQHPLFASTRASAAGPALRESISRFAGDQWLRDDHRLMPPDVDRIHLLKTRTLLLTGGRDLEDFRVIAALLEASAANLSRIDHPGLGHLLHLEDAAGCAREILAFLSH
jgi:pimeloyl-ACP methyl ester carboxylesterase